MLAGKIDQFGLEDRTDQDAGVDGGILQQNAFGVVRLGAGRIGEPAAEQLAGAQGRIGGHPGSAQRLALVDLDLAVVAAHAQTRRVVIEADLDGAAHVHLLQPSGVQHAVRDDQVIFKVERFGGLRRGVPAGEEVAFALGVGRTDQLTAVFDALRRRGGRGIFIVQIEGHGIGVDVPLGIDGHVVGDLRQIDRLGQGRILIPDRIQRVAFADDLRDLRRGSIDRNVHSHFFHAAFIGIKGHRVVRAGPLGIQRHVVFDALGQVERRIVFGRERLGIPAVERVADTGQIQIFRNSDSLFYRGIDRHGLRSAGIV